MTLFDPAATVKDRLGAWAQALDAIRRDDRPILIGPWRSELGFEATYFQPFVAGLAQQIKGFAGRSALITRGGTAVLYQPHVTKAVDLYAVRKPTDVKRQNLYDQRHSGVLKQVVPTDWDTAVLRDAADALGLGLAYHVIHPAWMYWLLAPFWEGTQGLRHLQGLTDYGPLPRLELGAAPLPAEYLAVRFYARATFPFPDPAVTDFVRDVVGGLAAQLPVVLLQTPDLYDDHLDVPLTGPNVFTLPAVKPEEHLAMHAAVIQRSRAFVGTYGGVAQLALRLGAPSMSFYAAWGGTAVQHLHLNDHLAKVTRVPFLVSSIADMGLWKQGSIGIRLSGPVGVPRSVAAVAP